MFFQGCPLCCLWCQNPEGQHAVGAARSYSLDELLYLVRIDRPFYDATGGGVTVSGGEPCMQMAFIGEFLRRLQEEGIDTAIETCGFFHYAFFAKHLLPYLDRIYFDLKIWDEQQHRRLTGQSNRPVFANLLKLVKAGAPVQVRIPLVPGMTATSGNLAALGLFLREHGIMDATLLPYNPLWQEKAVRLGRIPAVTSGYMTREQLDLCRAYFAGCDQL